MQNDYWTILKGTKNYKDANRFIEFASRPESQAAFAKLQAVGPLNKRAFDLLPAERTTLLPTYPENLVHAIDLNDAWWAETESSGNSNLEKQCNVERVGSAVT